MSPGPTSYRMVGVMDYSAQPPEMQVERIGPFLLKDMQSNQNLPEYTGIVTQGRSALAAI